MALTVGTDTYISITDATAYLTANYLSTDAKLIAWNALTDGNKEVLLRKATKVIDQQPVAGFKVQASQALAFPRYVYTDVGIRNINALYNVFEGGEWYQQTAVPDAVKYAQCEIAIDAINPSTRATMQREGVKSFSLGSLSESYGSGRASALPSTAKDLLAPIMGGGVSIC